MVVTSYLWGLRISIHCETIHPVHCRSHIRVRGHCNWRSILDIIHRTRISYIQLMCSVSIGWIGMSERWWIRVLINRRRSWYSSPVWHAGEVEQRGASARFQLRAHRRTASFSIGRRAADISSWFFRCFLYLDLKLNLR